MKKIILLLLILQSGITFGNTSKKQLNFETRINGAAFCVDKRIELFYIVAMLADYPRINGFNASYKQDIREYFSPYLSHEIFSFIKEIGRKWYLDTPINFMLYFTNDFQLRTDVKLPDDLVSLCGGMQKVEKFRDLMRDFSIKSNYQAFLKANAQFYNTILTTSTYNLRNFDGIKRLEDYYKQKQLKYTIIFNLLGRGNFGPNISTHKGNEIYAIIAPESQTGDISNYLDDRTFNNLI